MTVETLVPDQSRRKFLGIDYFFARRSRGGKPHRRPGSETSLNPSQPPDTSRFRVTRRQAIWMIVGGTIAAGGAITALSRPWNLLTPQPDQEDEETLESLVAQAKKMESEFDANDLSNERIRNNFTSILADIYSKDASSSYNKKQIANSVIWTRNLDEFIKLVTDNSQRGQEKSRDYFADMPAITTDNKKIIINLANPAFNTSLLRANRFPGDWNALKSLRHILLHEFVHLTTIAKKDDEFFALTDIPKNVTDPIIEGFLVQFKEAGRNREIFHIFNELVVETITSERSNRLFGPTPPWPFIEQGVDLRTAQIRLRQILDAARINISDLERFSRTSNLYGFLVSLSSKVDFPADTSLAGRINYVLSLLDAILYNNQTVIQEYINRTQARQR